MKTNLTINVDIRKTHPLGASLSDIARAARAAFEKGVSMGLGNRGLAGYTEHMREYERTMDEARRLHSALLYIAALVGPEVAVNVNDLAWALNVDGYTGLPRTEGPIDAARAVGVEVIS